MGLLLKIRFVKQFLLHLLIQQFSRGLNSMTFVHSILLQLLEHCPHSLVEAVLHRLVVYHPVTKQTFLHYLLINQLQLVILVAPPNYFVQYLIVTYILILLIAINKVFLNFFKLNYNLIN